MSIFDLLKRLFLYVFLACCFLAGAQDKIYLLDGSCTIAKVLEVAPEKITVVAISESGAPFRDANETISKNDILLIEYKSGFVEIYNLPQKNTTYYPEGVRPRSVKKDDQQDVDLDNLVSVNSLALCNSDLAGFAERLFAGRRLGAGAMFAYNFNRYVTQPNGWIIVLSNAKKNYDVGAFLNFYPGHFKRRSTFYMGMLFKYTSFRFTKLIEENNGTSVSVRYEPAKGSQMATLVNVGIHTNISKNFFIKTFAGIGGFKLKGEYKDQFNYFANKDKGPREPRVSYNSLPKVYLGFNLGFSF